MSNLQIYRTDTDINLIGKISSSNTFVLLCNASKRTFSVLLPDSNLIKNINIIIIKIDNTSNIITISCNVPSQLVNGMSSYTLNSKKSSLQLFPCGNDGYWFYIPDPSLEHSPATVKDSDSINFTITGQEITGVVLSNGVDHSTLNNLNTSNYTHLTAANHTDLTDGGATTLHKHDHGSLDGLSDDDHSQYHNNVRGDVRYPTLIDPSVIDNFVSFSNITGGQKDSGKKASDFATSGHTHDFEHFDESFLLMGS